MYEIDGRKYRGRHSIVEKSDDLEKKFKNQSTMDLTPKSYSNMVKSSKNLREIIAEARNEEQQEDRDKKTRETNIIIHGIHVRSLPIRQRRKSGTRSFQTN